MTLKRTVAVPKTESVEFVRHARIEHVGSGGTGVVFRLADENGRLHYKARCLVSEDPAGDRMRGAPLTCEGYTNPPANPMHEVVVFTGQIGTEVAGDWLWAELPRAQEDLREAIRRAVPAQGPYPFGLGEIVGGGRLR